ncbi:MAG: tetratricopeptide repeat protein [Candidatus Krumholzibacteria bacterium]|nr:tetratricopeptide repeat protein [Candidatus Krumholzibacteria bacterium]
MKKTMLLTVAALMLITSGAVAQEKSLFSIYLGDRTTENFMKAWESYEQMRADTVNHNATVVLAYLALIELDRNLEMLAENADSLSARNMFQYANILLELERYDESVALYEKLNEKSPKWSCPWRHKGEAYWEMKKYEEAEKALLKAIETRETHYDAYVWLARVYRDMNRYEEALSTLEKGLSYHGKDIEDPEEEVSGVDVGFLHLDLLGKCGRTEEYEKQYEKMKKIAPDDERLK